MNADELFGKTAGNPFFVTEVLASEKEEISPTIRDAVLARAARLSTSAAALLETVAVAPPQVELWLLEALAGDVIERLDECLTSGMLTHGRDGVALRHELARLSVEESLRANRRLSLHRKALAALADPPVGAPDLERLARTTPTPGGRPLFFPFPPPPPPLGGPPWFLPRTLCPLRSATPSPHTAHHNIRGDPSPPLSLALLHPKPVEPIETLGSVSAIPLRLPPKHAQTRRELPGSPPYLFFLLLLA